MATKSKGLLEGVESETIRLTSDLRIQSVPETLTCFSSFPVSEWLVDNFDISSFFSAV